MPTFSLPIDAWTEATVQQVVADQHPETDTVEFKRELPFSSPRDKAEVAKDVSAMANGSGGWIIYGIEETPGPSGVKTAGATTPMTLGTNAPPTGASWIDDVIAGHVTPRPSYRIREIPTTIGGIFIVVHVVPLSDDLHMTRDRFYRRSERSARPMSEPDVRQAYDAIGRRRNEAELWVTRVARADTEDLPAKGFFWGLVPHTFREVIDPGTIDRHDPALAHIDSTFTSNLIPFVDGVDMKPGASRLRIRRDGSVSSIFDAIGNWDAKQWRPDTVLRELLDILAIARLKWRDARIVEPATLVLIARVLDVLESPVSETSAEPSIVFKDNQEFRIPIRQDDLHHNPLSIARAAMIRLVQGMGSNQIPCFKDDGSLEPALGKRLDNVLRALNA